MINFFLYAMPMFAASILAWMAPLAAIVSDPGLIQFGVGAVVSALTGWVFKNHTPANNRFVTPFTSLVTAGLYYGLGAAGITPPVPFGIAFGQGSATAVTVGATHGALIGIPQGRNPFKETDADRAARLAKQQK